MWLDYELATNINNKEVNIMKKYNHAYDIAFSLESDNDGESVTAAEMRTALLKRIDDLERECGWVEACGMPFDTFENGED